MISIKNAFIGISILFLIITGSGCLSQQDRTAQPSGLPDYEVLEKAGKTCSDCHYTVASLLPVEGGRHIMECTICHIQHGVKPQCTKCHELVHGTQLQNCKDCHDEHAPLNRITDLSGPTFERSCFHCHTRQFEDFSYHPGRHADLKCIYCHQVHRQITPCINCHAPHSKELTYGDCLNCHPAHKPLEIDYPENIARDTCAICHEQVDTALRKGGTKHNNLNCSYCHPVHKQIPECMNCHSPHSLRMTNDDCAGCHPAHNPIDMEFPPATQRDDCTLCHQEIDVILRNSNTKHDDLGCIYCHPRHRYLPTCESCHGLPHNRDIHDSFPLCNQCHIISHDVKNIVFNT